MSIKKNVDNYLKNLKLQIQVESMNLNSWGDVKPRQPNRQFELPSADMLLNDNKELENKQLARQQQITLYLEKEKRPVVINGVEYKYNQIPEPVLTDTNVIEAEVQRAEGELSNEQKKYNDLVNDLKLTNKKIELLENEINKLNEEKHNLTVQFGQSNNELTQKQEELQKLEARRNDLDQKINDLNKQTTTKSNLLSQTDPQSDKFSQLEAEIKELQTNKGLFHQEKITLKHNEKNIENEINSLKPQAPLNDIKRIENEIVTILNVDLPKLKQDKANIENLLAITDVEIDNKRSEISKNKNDFKNAIRDNNKLTNEYASELKRVNMGSFNVERLPTETEEQYVQRLTINSQIPFDNSTAKTLSDIERNNLFKDNLKLLFQSNPFIEKILNYYKTTNDHYIFIMNQYFNLFKEDYLKVYGYNNKSIVDNPETFIEIVDNFCRAGDDGKPELITPSKDIENKQKYLTLEPLLNKLSTIEKFVNPIQSLTYQEQANELLRLQTLPMKTPQEEKIQEILTEEEVLRNKINAYIKGFTDNQKNILKLEDPADPTNKKYLMYINQDVKKANEYDDDGNIIKTIQFTHTKNKPILLMSYTGNKGTFKELSNRKSENYSLYKELLYKFLKLNSDDIQRLFGISSTGVIPVEGIIKIITLLGLQPTLLAENEIPILKNPRKSTTKESRPIIGLGIKEDIPEYVEFGKYILLLKKLFLKNILSIHKKNHQKVPGFKNYNVSNEFVNLIMKLIKKENLTPQDLSTLKLGEKELLDTLLTLCELNKKIITGSGSETLNKVKEQLKLIEGQIEAGNNNPLMKDELYKVLFKLVSLGSITEKQARTHYKNICNDFFI